MDGDVVGGSDHITIINVLMNLNEYILCVVRGDVQQNILLFFPIFLVCVFN